MIYSEDFEGQRDKCFEPLNAPTEPSIISDQSVEGDFEDAGAGNYTRTIMLAVGDMDDEALQEWCENRWPPQHCQHEYDCCGKYYRQGLPEIDRSGKFAKVTLVSIQNV